MYTNYDLTTSSWLHWFLYKCKRGWCRASPLDRTSNLKLLGILQILSTWLILYLPSDDIHHWTHYFSCLQYWSHIKSVSVHWREWKKFKLATSHFVGGKTGIEGQLHFLNLRDRLLHVELHSEFAVIMHSLLCSQSWGHAWSYRIVYGSTANPGFLRGKLFRVLNITSY